MRTNPNLKKNKAKAVNTTKAALSSVKTKRTMDTMVPWPTETPMMAQTTTNSPRRTKRRERRKARNIRRKKRQKK